MIVEGKVLEKRVQDRKSWWAGSKTLLCATLAQSFACFHVHECSNTLGDEAREHSGNLGW